MPETEMLDPGITEPVPIADNGNNGGKPPEPEKTPVKERSKFIPRERFDAVSDERDQLKTHFKLLADQNELMSKRLEEKLDIIDKRTTPPPPDRDTNPEGYRLWQEQESDKKEKRMLESVKREAAEEVKRILAIQQRGMTLADSENKARAEIGYDAYEQMATDFKQMNDPSQARSVEERVRMETRFGKVLDSPDPAKALIAYMREYDSEKYAKRKETIKQGQVEGGDYQASDTHDTLPVLDDSGKEFAIMLGKAKGITDPKLAIKSYQKMVALTTSKK